MNVVRLLKIFKAKFSCLSLYLSHSLSYISYFHNVVGCIHVFSVWLDVRSANLVKHYISKSKRNNSEFLKPICGLPISTYFSALKLRWLIDNIPEVKKAVLEKRCLFGTVDSWLIWVSQCYVDHV